MTDTYHKVIGRRSDQERGILNVVNGDKDAVDAPSRRPRHQGHWLRRLDAVPEYVYTRGAAAGKRVQCFGGAKNHMIVMPDAHMSQAVDALIGAGYGSAGERCIAVSVAVPVGKATAKELVKRLIGPYRPCSTLSLKNPPLGIAIAAGFDQSCDLDSFDTLGPFS